MDVTKREVAVSPSSTISSGTDDGLFLAGLFIKVVVSMMMTVTICSSLEQVDRTRTPVSVLFNPKGRLERGKPEKSRGGEKKARG